MVKIIKPCGKCPYKLGLVQTLTNPCPRCKRNNYSAYEQFVNERNVYTTAENNKK